MIDEDLELLRRCAGEPAPPSEASVRAARRALTHAIGEEGGAARPARVRVRTAPRRARRGWRVAVATAVAATVLVLGVTLHSGSTATGPATAAAAVLDRLALAAAAQPTDVPGPGEYLYTASVALTGSDTVLAGGAYCVAVYAQHRESWIAADGAGLVRETDGRPRYSSARDAAICRGAPDGGGTAPGTSQMWAAPGCLGIDPVPFAGLPINPAKLRARLLTGKVEGGPPGPGEAFVQVGDLLRETDAAPALRAALYRAAAGLRGVFSLGTVTDERGRRGIGLALDSHGTRHELIFAPHTGALMAERDIALGRGGHVVDWTTYSAGRVQRTLPQRSPLPLDPACAHSIAKGLNVPGHPRDTVLVGAPGEDGGMLPQPAAGTQ
ncbi:MAG TPA: CU044_5270 family protein [Solirubrobacteraceae bacterium]|jgi:hypothetical protein|nr:CU044_5270 family protein [Solirubrobacteraceae bacterium]